MRNITKQTNTKVGRDSSVELLRIVLMLMIILHHFLVHGTGLADLIEGTYQVQPSSPYYMFVNSFLVIGVNCFVLISGYYGIKLKANTALSFMLQTSFYSIIFFCLFDLSNDTFTLQTIKRSLFPISRNLWWFVTAYFFLLLLSPFLNLAKNNFNKMQFAFIILIFSIVNCIIAFVFNPSSLGVNNGYSLISFINIYLIGQFMRSYPSYRIKYSGFVYVGCSTLIFLLAYVALQNFPQPIVWKVFQYNNPLVLISSIAFFCSFLKLSFSSSKVNYIAASVFGVYLIHEHPRVAEFLYSNVKQLEADLGTSYFLISLLLLAVILFFTCVMVEKLRYLVFEPISSFGERLATKYKLDIFT